VSFHQRIKSKPNSLACWIMSKFVTTYGGLTLRHIASAG